MTKRASFLNTTSSFMNMNPNIKICGGQIYMFDNNNNYRGKSQHKSISWEQYKQNPSHWFINHPTVCYRKSAIIAAGNYDESLKQMCEDFELELRMLKTHGYGGADVVGSLCGNPTFPQDKGTPIFDLVEHMDTAECFEVIRHARTSWGDSCVPTFPFYILPRMPFVLSSYPGQAGSPTSA